jgi:signal transduction histidine kinase
MHNIIQELLLLAQVSRADVRAAPVDMPALIRRAQRRLTQMSTTYAAEIELMAPEQWPVALGYGPWVEEVWVNYLSNAMKYGGRPPRATIGGEQLDGTATARFWVHDAGPGIPAEMQDKLFVEFTRLSQARVQGHGLGLSIVRRIVEKLGGSVGVESSVGCGSTFYFTLPLQVSAQPA